MSSPTTTTCRRATPVSDVATLMIENKIDCLPVVDHDDDLVGLVTSSDLLALLRDRESADETLEGVTFRLSYRECGAGA